jgi:hypothetical protein
MLGSYGFSLLVQRVDFSGSFFRFSGFHIQLVSQLGRSRGIAIGHGNKSWPVPVVSYAFAASFP